MLPLVPSPSALPALGHEAASRLVDSFLSGRKATTLDAYRRDLDAFRAFVGADSLDEAAALLLGRGHGPANGLALEWKADLVHQGLSSSTIARRLAALRSLVRFARTLGLVPWALEVESPKVSSYRDTRGPGLEGIRLLLDFLEDEERQARTDSKEARLVKVARDRALVWLLFSPALRRGAVARLDVEDLDLEAGTVAVLEKGKTEKELRTLPPAAVEALAAWLAHRGSMAGPLFVSLSRDPAKHGRRLTGRGLHQVVRSLGKAAGLRRGLWPHALRHAGITEACRAAQRAGLPLEAVQDFSGHADVRTLMVYRDRERNLQGQIASLVAASTVGG